MTSVKKLSKPKIINNLRELYGMTETGGATTNRPGHVKLGSVGKSWPNYDWPSEGAQTTVSPEGEIIVGGPNVMLRYHNKPEGTAEVLRDGWMHSGDVAELDEDGWSRDLLAALLALPDDAPKAGTAEEVPYRVFGVRVFNDSKRFDTLKGAIARLARRHRPERRALSDRGMLRELGLVANPGHLYLYGPWQLVDERGQMRSLSEFHLSMGIPTAPAAL